MRFTVVFLTADAPPMRILLLKRGDDRTFAPGFYTGPGGKVEPGEIPACGAVRELSEETGITGVALKEFAHLVVNRADVVHYFTAPYPLGDFGFCPEGTLEWHGAEQIDRLPVIKSTRLVLSEWRDRGFITDRQFTVSVVRDDISDPESAYTSVHVQDGLTGYAITTY